MNNRLQKKCIIAATSFHLLLVLILLVGPAFFSPDSKRERTQEIDFVPAILIDEALQGGGSPKGGQTAPPPQKNDPPPTPKLPDPPVKDPEPKQDQQAVEPVKPVVKPPPKQKQEETEEAVDPTPPKPKHTVKVDLTEVKNNATAKPKPQNSARTANSDSSADKELAKAIEALKGTAKGIRSSVSGSTSVEMRGPGGGGPTYAGYNSEIQRIYKQRYDLYLSSAGNVGEEQTSVEASITISRDGTVTSTKIVTPSRNAALNKLVERVLDSVNKLRPFPEGSKDAQRTLNIIFELTPKQGLG
ncbi:MAG: TonB C-terminal domain-containing protein [Verrucomicrobia bacterium]|nr:TonB C-terminal domain-containing protein [Verrucomicrobiota bacterium]